MRRQANSRRGLLLFFFPFSVFICICGILSVPRRAAASPLCAEFVGVHHVQPSYSSSPFPISPYRDFLSNSRLSTHINEKIWLPLQAPPSQLKQGNHEGRKKATLLRKAREIHISSSQGGFRSARDCGMLCISVNALVLQHPAHSRRRVNREKRFISSRVSQAEKIHSAYARCILSNPLESIALFSTVADKSKVHSRRPSRTCCQKLQPFVALLSARELLQRKWFPCSSEVFHTVSSTFLRLRHTRQRVSLLHLSNSILRSRQPRRHVRAVKRRSDVDSFSVLNVSRRRYCGAFRSSKSPKNCLLLLHIPYLHVPALRTDPSIHHNTGPYSHTPASSMKRTAASGRGYVTGAVMEKLLASAEESASPPSEMENDEYLLPGVLRVAGMPYCLKVGEIPGDGDCLFAALAACLWYSMFGTHSSPQAPAFKDMTYNLRQLAVDTLEQPFVRSFTLDENEEISPAELVRRASEAYGLSSVAYLNRLRLPGTWGGGPEIVALSHALKRVICVYEIDFSSRSENTDSSSSTPTPVTNAGEFQSAVSSSHPGVGPAIATRSAAAEKSLLANRPPQRLRAETLCKGQPLKLVACLGYPANVANEPLHILFISSAVLSLTSTSPSSRTNGDHFMPLFPCLSQPERLCSETSHNQHSCVGSRKDI